MTGQTQEHEHCLPPGCGRRWYCKASRPRDYGWGCRRRQLHDGGLPIAEARRQADAQLGFSTSA